MVGTYGYLCNIISFSVSRLINCAKSVFPLCKVLLVTQTSLEPTASILTGEISNSLFISVNLNFFFQSRMQSYVALGGHELAIAALAGAHALHYTKSHMFGSVCCRI